MAREGSYLTRSSSFLQTFGAALARGLFLVFFLSNQARSSLPSDCPPQFSRLHLSNERFQASFQALKQDLPHINDPVQLVLDFSERRRTWNFDYPEGHIKRNNFPAPELLSGVNEVRKQLSQIKRPPENRLAAEKLLRELAEAEKAGLPYKDTYRKIEAATYLIQLRFRNPTEKAAAIGLSSRMSQLLPLELGEQVRELMKKHQIENVIPEYHLTSQKDLDQFSANAAGYFKELGSKLNQFFKTAEGNEWRRSLAARRMNLDSDSEKRELDAILKIFVEDDQRGIQRFITRPTITDNPTHPLGVPLVDESLFENEILLPTSRALTIEGLAESFMIGITPVQIISRPRIADDLWMDSYLFANHDGFHRYLAARESQISREIIDLPLGERLQILAEIDRMPSPENRSLARTALYLTVHENGSNSNLPINTAIAAAHTRDEFKRLAGRTLSSAEITWVRNWYRQTVQRRVDHFRRPSPP